MYPAMADSPVRQHGASAEHSSGRLRAGNVAALSTVEQFHRHEAVGITAARAQRSGDHDRLRRAGSPPRPRRRGGRPRTGSRLPRPTSRSLRGSERLTHRSRARRNPADGRPPGPRRGRGRRAGRVSSRRPMTRQDVRCSRGREHGRLRGPASPPRGVGGSCTARMGECHGRWGSTRPSPPARRAPGPACRSPSPTGGTGDGGISPWRQRCWRS